MVATPMPSLHEYRCGLNLSNLHFFLGVRINTAFVLTIIVQLTLGHSLIFREFFAYISLKIWDNYIVQMQEG